jgi:mannosyltransferase OCH1-like enzyme
MIPPIIHYCWFGKGGLPPLARKCIESWKRHMPHCEIREWNEENFDVNIIPYTRDAYASRKFAFVSDYARFHILNEHGGIYLDVDVELIRSLDPLLQDKVVLGFEREGQVNPGLICASEPGTKFLNEMIAIYRDLSFIDEDGRPDLTTIVTHTSEYLYSQGLKPYNRIQRVGDVTIYPVEFFCPIDMATNELKITSNTYSIHHFAGSWLSPWVKFKKNVRRLLGAQFYDSLRGMKQFVVKEKDN